MILGLVPLSLRLLVFSPCFAVSLRFNFRCVLFLPLLALLSPDFHSYSIPLSLLQSHFPCFLSFPCQSLYLEGIWDFKKQRGEDVWCTFLALEQPPTLTLQVLVVSDGTDEPVMLPELWHINSMHRHAIKMSCKFIVNSYQQLPRHCLKSPV